MSRPLGWLLCLVGDHDWTTRHQRGEIPDVAEIHARPVEYFWEWSTAFCDRCGHVADNQRTTR